MKTIKVIYEGNDNEYKITQKDKDCPILYIHKNSKYYGLICMSDIISYIEAKRKIRKEEESRGVKK